MNTIIESVQKEELKRRAAHGVEELTESKQLVDRVEDYTDRSLVAAGWSDRSQSRPSRIRRSLPGEVGHPTVVLIGNVECYLCGCTPAMNKQDNAVG